MVGKSRTSKQIEIHQMCTIAHALLDLFYFSVFLLALPTYLLVLIYVPFPLQVISFSVKSLNDFWDLSEQHLLSHWNSLGWTVWETGRAELIQCVIICLVHWWICGHRYAIMLLYYKSKSLNSRKTFLSTCMQITVTLCACSLGFWKLHELSAYWQSVYSFSSLVYVSKCHLPWPGLGSNGGPFKHLRIGHEAHNLKKIIEFDNLTQVSWLKSIPLVPLGPED